MNARLILAAATIVLATSCAGSTSPSLPTANGQAASARHATATEKVLYSFSGGTDGGGPIGSIAFDSSGDAFGTTHFGGVVKCGGNYGGGCGVVFELIPNKSGAWSETPLYAFNDGSDGGFPNAGLILDKTGNLYGTASTGGSSACSIGCGVVYELRKNGGWSESILQTFTGSDGEFPNAVLLPSSHGTLYSTTWFGGSTGNGTVFSLSPTGSGWTERVLYSFGGTTDGSAPAGGVIADRSGNLYGTTYKFDGDNDGVAFELRKRAHGLWKDSVLYTFTNNGGGEDPYAGLIMSSNRKLFGAAIEGGPDNGGVVFGLVLNKHHAWTEKVVHAFGSAGDGSSPYGGLVADKSGNLYGTTVFGGTSNSGTVYELSHSHGKWIERILYSFSGGSDGANPNGALTLDRSGNLYGTAEDGGQSGHGVVFEIIRA
ncbi:MAG TPA: choice-of-anchor tandem repeat GloVer-containing protein [Candidatus Cybelea sp.]